MKSLLSFLVLFSPIALFAQGPFTFPTQYKAEMIGTTEGQTVKSKIFVDGDKMRMEMNTSGMDMAAIVDKASNTCYTLMPAQKMCMVVPMKSMGKGTDFLPSANTKFEYVGKETINSKVCDKYKATIDQKEFLTWIESSTKLPVRQASADGKVTVDWSDFQAGPQSASLFEVPSDYQKMDMSSFGNMDALKGMKPE